MEEEGRVGGGGGEAQQRTGRPVTQRRRQACQLRRGMGFQGAMGGGWRGTKGGRGVGRSRAPRPPVRQSVAGMRAEHTIPKVRVARPHYAISLCI